MARRDMSATSYHPDRKETTEFHVLPKDKEKATEPSPKLSTH